MAFHVFAPSHQPPRPDADKRGDCSIGGTLPPLVKLGDDIIESHKTLFLTAVCRLLPTAYCLLPSQPLQERIDFVRREVFVKVVIHLHGRRATARAKAFHFFQRE